MVVIILMYKEPKTDSVLNKIKTNKVNKEHYLIGQDNTIVVYDETAMVAILADHNTIVFFY